MNAVAATLPSTRRLSEVARHVVVPSGIVTTGWPAVERRCGEFGDEFDLWQVNAGQVILGKRADGMYAATVGGVTLSIPRQVAKTFLVGRIVFALCIEFPGLKVLWTAHRMRTATNTFNALKGYARRKKVLPYMKAGPKNGIREANGEQEIAFANGSVIMFGAREAGFGRGFDLVDIEVFDEAQILTDKALEDMVAATNQSRHPHGALLFYMGTPPRPVDPGDVFRSRRAEALSGVSEDQVYIECSADPDADPDDRAQWAKANASFPHRTPLQSMLRLRKNLPRVESWRREALGIWDDEAGSGGVIPDGIWAAGTVTEVAELGRRALVWDVSPDRSWSSVGWMADAGDGFHEEVVESAAGTDWVPGRVADYVSAAAGAVAVVGCVKGSPAEAMVDDVQRALDARACGLTVEVLPATEYVAACGDWFDKTMSLGVRHLDQAWLTNAMLAAEWSFVGDTRRLARRRASGDITALCAVVAALRLLALTPAAYAPAGMSSLSESAGDEFFRPSQRLNL